MAALLIPDHHPLFRHALFRTTLCGAPANAAPPDRPPQKNTAADQVRRCKPTSSGETGRKS